VSNAAITAVVDRSKARGIARLVLVVLADRADESGKTWCGTQDIARRANIGRANVARVLKDLCTLGELTVEHGAGRHGTHVYRISPGIMAKPSQAETASPRSEGCFKVKQRVLRDEAHTPLYPIEPTKAAVVELPFSSPEFDESWKDWMRHRKEKRQALTPTAIRQQLAKLAEMGEERARAALSHSIACGYTGLFEPRAVAEKPRYLPDGSPRNDAARRLVAAKPSVSPL